MDKFGADKSGARKKWDCLHELASGGPQALERITEIDE